ncbi:MAG: hypothetical protein ACRD41_04260, partial [Candidatus Acidiferrales bacterium]
DGQIALFSDHMAGKSYLAPILPAFLARDNNRSCEYWCTCPHPQILDIYYANCLPIGTKYEPISRARSP